MKKYIFDYNTVTNVIDDCLGRIFKFLCNIIKREYN